MVSLFVYHDEKPWPRAISPLAAGLEPRTTVFGWKEARYPSTFGPKEIGITFRINL